MQGATLIARITGAMFMLSTSLMSVMMVHVSDLAALPKIDSDILLVLECMLDVGGD
jgi:hypothetical protein